MITTAQCQRCKGTFRQMVQNGEHSTSTQVRMTMIQCCLTMFLLEESFCLHSSLMVIMALSYSLFPLPFCPSCSTPPLLSLHLFFFPLSRPSCFLHFPSLYFILPASFILFSSTCFPQSLSSIIPFRFSSFPLSLPPSLLPSSSFSLASPSPACELDVSLLCPSCQGRRRQAQIILLFQLPVCATVLQGSADAIHQPRRMQLCCMCSQEVGRTLLYIGGGRSGRRD